MRISIITVCFNSEKTIADTLNSVKLQSYKNIEHLLIDGGSTDNTLSLIKNYQNSGSEYPIRCLSEPDQGLYDAMNKGIQLSSGDYIGFLNADDFYTDAECIRKLVDALIQNQTKSCYADLDYIDSIVTNKIIRRWKAGEFKPNSFLWGWMPPHPTFFVSREVYIQLGGYRLDLGSAADYELMLRFLHKHQISTCYLPQTIIKMRMGGVSNASLKNRIAANRMDKKAWEINGLKPLLFTLLLKPIRKLNQFKI